MKWEGISAWEYHSESVFFVQFIYANAIMLESKTHVKIKPPVGKFLKGVHKNS